MAFRALLFSKETNAALTAACQDAGIQLEICDDIFSAIDKGTKQQFSCVLVNWSDQPEAGFLLKRTRESANASTVAIAIVDREPAAAEMRDHCLNFLIYRPIAAQEAKEVLAKAKEKMPSVAEGKRLEIPKPPAPERAQSPTPDQNPGGHLAGSPPASVTMYQGPDHADSAAETESAAPEPQNQPTRPFPLRWAVAAVVVIAASYCLWEARGTISYLARTRENRGNIVKDSLSAIFGGKSSNPRTASPDPAPDPYFTRTPATADSHPQLGVVSAETDVSEARPQLRNPSDLPLPSPVYEAPPPPPPAPFHTARGTVPDSLRGSAPIAPPVVVTVTPAQMLSVSSPMVPPVSTQQFTEPITVSEEAERALLIHSVAPEYPAEAAAQKLRGPVVLQATIGRDGSVEDLKIVRGSFLLSKAAIAAVKQWRFKPYTLNGHPAQTQTYLTIEFSSPAS